MTKSPRFTFVLWIATLSLALGVSACTGSTRNPAATPSSSQASEQASADEDDDGRVNRRSR